MRVRTPDEMAFDWYVEPVNVVNVVEDKVVNETCYVCDMLNWMTKLFLPPTDRCGLYWWNKAR